MEAAVVPVGLAGMPPGPELAALLAGIDVARVPNEQVLEVLRAESRQLAHQQGRLFAMLAEVGRCEPVRSAGVVERAAAPVEESIHEIGTALRCTPNAAFAEHDLAEELRTRLPAVLAALLTGSIDRAKARLFVENCRELTERQVARVCAALLPVAPQLTTGQLADRLRRLLMALDPEALARRYRKAVRERQVFGYLGRDGTATLGASGLSPGEAAASSQRVWELARAVRAGGHPAPLSQIRADLFVALLDGSLQEMSNAEIVEAMLARCTTDSAPLASKSGEASVGEPAAGETSADENLAGERSAGESTGETSHAKRSPSERRAGVEVRIRLSTLLGLDEHPGEIAGWGAIPSGPARETVARQYASTWRFAITDEAGYLLLAGVTRRRPRTGTTAGHTIGGTAGQTAGGTPGQTAGTTAARTTGGAAGQTTGGTVEVQVRLRLLRRLAAEPPPGAERLVADLIAQWGRRGELRAALRAFSGARFPHAALRRHVEVRDRTCCFPGCRRPARAGQQDHTDEFQHGGATVEENLGPLCVRHHALKSRGRWRLRQPAPGRFCWVGPLGGRYRTHGEPITPPLPDPVPGDPEPEEIPGASARDTDRPPDFGPTPRRPHRSAGPAPPPSRPPRPPPPRRGRPAADDEPPF